MTDTMQTQVMPEVLDSKKRSEENLWQRFQPLVWKWVKGLISVGLLAWLAFQVDWHNTLAALQTIPWFVTALGFLLISLVQMLGAGRFQLLLAAQGIQISYLYSIRLTWAGLFVNNFLPGSVGGDVVKVMALSRRGHGPGIPIACVMADRLINLVAATILLLATVIFVPDLIKIKLTDAINFIGIGVSIGGGILLAGIIYVILRPLFSRLKMIHIGSSLQTKMYKLVNGITTIIVRWVDKPKVLLLTLGLSWGLLLLSISAVWVTSQGLGITISFIELTAIIMLIYFVTLLPISLNGLGVQEVSLIYLLSRGGTTPEQALALAVLVRLFYVGVSLPGALDLVTRQKTIFVNSKADNQNVTKL